MDKNRIVYIVEKVVGETLGETPTDVFVNINKLQTSVEAVFRIKGEPHQLLLKIDAEGAPVSITIDGERYSV